MEYKGKLYGRIGGENYFDTGKTSDDYDQLEASQKVLIDENIKLRIFLWINHNPQCTLGSLYGDDGEMHCAYCKIDFKKEPIDQIILKLKEVANN